MMTYKVNVGGIMIRSVKSLGNQEDAELSDRCANFLNYGQ